MIKIHNQKTFLNNYEQFFLSDELQYSLILGITKRNQGIELLISSTIDDRFIVGVLAGKNLIIAANTLEKDVYYELVEYMEKVNYPGIIGTKENCNLYHEIYQELTNKELYLKMDQRIYSCNKVTDYAMDLGTIRSATKNDVNLLVEWGYDFTLDIDPHVKKEDIKKGIEQKVDNDVLFLLEVNNEIVSMAQRSRSLNQTESIGYVYTPPHHRRKGYASIIVTDVTKRILEDGRIATLYTDLSNPTSNSIYMKIGYIPYCDSVMLNKEN